MDDSRLRIASVSCSAALVAVLALSASAVTVSSGYAESDAPEGFAAVSDHSAVDIIAAESISDAAVSVAMAAPIEDAVDAADAYIQERLAQQYAYCEPQPYCYSSPYAANPCSLMYDGVQSDGEHTYTWYSQNVLPGGGLDIPGRHVGDGGYVMDGDGNIAVASSDYEQGTVIETPYGTAKVYDSGCASGVIDVYTDW